MNERKQYVAYLGILFVATFSVVTASLSLIGHVIVPKLSDVGVAAAADAAGFPAVPLTKIASGTWVRPRAEIVGTVSAVRHEADDDWHIVLKDGNAVVVLEEIPQLRLPNGHPKVGQRITARGIVRWDGEHKWAELHPLISWEPAGP